MILQALAAYYEAMALRGDISMPGYAKVKVSFALNISTDGELVDVLPLRLDAVRGKKTVEIPQVMDLPEQVIRSMGIAPNFMCDNSSYLLGIDGKGKPARTLDCYNASRAFHLTTLDGADSPAARAVKAFFGTWIPEVAGENKVLQPYLKEITAGPNLVFLVDGEAFAHTDGSVMDAWDKHRSAAMDGPSMLCLVSGKRKPIAILHGKVKGVQDAQSSGAVLVGFNAPAYESYGRDGGQGLNAPVSVDAAFAYTTAVNSLIADQAHRQVIGDTTVVYWSEKASPVLQNCFSMSMNPQQDTAGILKGVFEKLAQGRQIDEVDLTERFYVLGLAPNAARIAVRFFIQDTFGSMLERLREHYDDLEIVRAPHDWEYLSLPSLLRETVNLKSKDKAASPLLSGAVLRSMLTGAPYPEALLLAVLGRIKAEQDDDDKGIRKITRGRAAIIKACLLRQPSFQYKEVITVALNESTDNRAYVLGRLFAVLERTQEEGNPGINTTIKDRYFTSACSTPQSVFPTLLKLSTHHIAKVDSGKYRAHDIGIIMDKLNVESEPFPSHLSLTDQGLFILGYYHQVQARFVGKKKEENGNV